MTPKWSINLLTMESTGTRYTQEALETVYTVNQRHYRRGRKLPVNAVVTMRDPLASIITRWMKLAKHEDRGADTLRMVDDWVSFITDVVPQKVNAGLLVRVDTGTWWDDIRSLNIPLPITERIEPDKRSIGHYPLKDAYQSCDVATILATDGIGHAVRRLMGQRDQIRLVLESIGYGELPQCAAWMNLKLTPYAGCER